jgi:site-specific DNA-methyltransferase (adenine-specific)
LSDHKLILGDCLDELPKIFDKNIDLVLTDPPYGTTACKWDSVIPFEPMWNQLKRVIKDNGCIALFGSEPFSSALRMSNIKNFKYDWIWNKKKGGNPLLSKIQPIKIFENIMIFEKKGKKVNYYPIMEKRNKIKYRGKNKGKQSELTKNSFTENKSYTHKYPKAILEISNASQSRKLHPTQKPVALLEYLIKTYTNENDTVLDFTMGSGSTGVACKNLNRNFIGIEKDDKYFDIAKQRIEGVLI